MSRYIRLVLFAFEFSRLIIESVIASKRRLPPQLIKNYGKMCYNKSYIFMATDETDIV